MPSKAEFGVAVFPIMEWLSRVEEDGVEINNLTLLNTEDS